MRIAMASDHAGRALKEEISYDGQMCGEPPAGAAILVIWHSPLVAVAAMGAVLRT